MIDLKIKILLVILLFLVGCNNHEIIEKKIITEKKEIVGKKRTAYKDFNETPIGIYRNKERIETFKTDIKVGKDIALFNIYPSNSLTLTYSHFGDSFYKEFMKYNKDNNLKIGFNLKYSTDDYGDISHTILNFEDTNDYEGYILIFLYDDYDLYKNNKIYSHIEEDKKDTRYSSIKLYPQSGFPKVNSKILLTVFTYDDMGDFDDNKEYRGNSKYSIEICDTDKTC